MVGFGQDEEELRNSQVPPRPIRAGRVFWLDFPEPTEKPTPRPYSESMGFTDGVSKLWVVQNRTGLNISGFRSHCDAIEGLIRMSLVAGVSKKDIQGAVANAITHMDDDEE